MKVYKVTLCVLDHDGLGETGLIEEIQNVRYPNDCVHLDVVSVESRDIGEWHDDHPLNRVGKRDAEFRRLFGDESL